MIKQYNCIPAGYEDELYDEQFDDDDDLYLGAGLQKLKITVVPDITANAGLDDADFDSKLSAEHDAFFNGFKMQWNIYKRTPIGDHSLQGIFMNSPEPLKLALQFFANCPGCNNLKNHNLAQHVLETVCALSRQHPELTATCDDNTRMVAFNFIKTCGIIQLIKAVIETYELRKIRELIVPKLMQLMQGGNYKDAAHWAIHLQMPEIFGVYDLIFPLILQDKVYVVEEYLMACKALQIPTLKFLDSLLDKKKTVYEHCYPILEKYKYPNAKHGILMYRPMSKLVTRLSKKFQIPDHLTPNLNFTKACSYIHYLHRRYQSGGMSLESWRELARDAATTKALQLDLIANVEQNNDLDEAVYWAQQFQVSLDECPKEVRLEIEQLRARSTPDKVDKDKVGGGGGSQGRRNSQQYAKSGGARSSASSVASTADDSSEYLKLELPDECIILVNTPNKFLAMLDYLQLQSLIGFDSEWKPSARNDSYVSLIQLATNERVYLLDCLARDIHADLWRQLGQRIFNNMEILKLGFSLRQDLLMLQRSLPLQLNVQATNCYLDLHDLWIRLKNMRIIVFPYGRSQEKSGLSSLTESCLGKKMDKSNQCSNWSNRPLRRDQIMYAALDAHCLLQIYEVFSVLLGGINLNIDEIIDEITNGKSCYLFTAKRLMNENNKKQQQGEGGGFSPSPPATAYSMSDSGCSPSRATNNKSSQNSDKPMSAADVKLICDSPFTSLTGWLRKLGLDTEEIKKLDVNHYIAMAQREGRFILTDESRQQIFAPHLPQHQIITLRLSDTDETLRSILSTLNVTVEYRNHFTRCLSCNGNDFLLARREDMQLLRYGKQKPQQHQQQQQQDWTKDWELADRNSAQGRLADYNDKTFNLLAVDDHIIKTRKTFAGKSIKINRLKHSIMRTKDNFFICDNCGCCTWDGEHQLPVGFL